MLILLTLSLKSQELGNKICLFPEEMDYFLRQDLRAKSLAKDSVLLADKLEMKSIDIATLIANEQDLKTEYKNQKTISANLQGSLNEVNSKYSETKDKLNRRTGILIGSMSLNLLFVGAVILIVR